MVNAPETDKAKGTSALMSLRNRWRAYAQKRVIRRWKKRECGGLGKRKGEAMFYGFSFSFFKAV
ncbi:MAG TPA: hypothetical protein VMW10_01605 [Alphaproteobacteria bacterium]|nr:hypothetical protein [Alphaproteobacteria bacterium]